MSVREMKTTWQWEMKRNRYSFRLTGIQTEKNYSALFNKIQQIVKNSTSISHVTFNCKKSVLPHLVPW